jgi:hypothetical protein
MLARYPEPDQVIDALENVAAYGVPSEGTAWILDVGTSGFLNFFENEILEKLILRGGATCRIFEGVYGSGKTHILELLSELALSRGMVVAKTDLSQAMNLGEWHQITRHILEHAVVQVDTVHARTLPIVLETLGGNYSELGTKLRKAQLPHPGFKKAMIRALDSDYPNKRSRELVHRYLLGERVRVTDLRASGVQDVKSPLSKKNAEQVLSTVSNGLSLIGLGGTLLLFDENERTLEVRGTTPSRRILLTANLLRRLIDGCAMNRVQGLVVVFAVLPGFLNRCMKAYPALGQRLSTSEMLGTPGWRSPVLEVPAANEIDDPNEFLDAMIERICELVRICEGKTTGLPRKLRSEGSNILASNAGSSYRRPLLKALANTALQEIDQ